MFKIRAKTSKVGGIKVFNTRFLYNLFYPFSRRLIFKNKLFYYKIIDFIDLGF